ncbi:MAG: YeeE/YedE family protein [Betaproteobacteria bacterium]
MDTTALMVTNAQLRALVIAGGFILAFVFGSAAQKTDFCTMGAVADIVNMGDWSRLPMWLLAIAVAIAGANALDLAGSVDLARSAYPAPGWPWLAYLVGGLLFGAGMTLASGCASRSLIRLGRGNLKSLVVVICLALAAEMTIGGLLAPLRTLLNAFAVKFDQGQDLSWILALLIGTTFIGPVAHASELLQYWSHPSVRMSFGVAVILGTLLGSFSSALVRRQFRWETFASAADTRNHVLGGVLMGFGGVTAMGCTIGQGITGVSTLALGSFLVLFSIIAGAALTMKLQYWYLLKAG